MSGATGGIRIEMFGGLRVVCSETVTARFPAQQTGALLAMLALNLHRPCTREELAGALWPEMDVNEGRRSLRQTLFKLRRQLAAALPSGEDLFLGHPHTIRLDPGRVTTDVWEFERAVQSAQRSPDTTERIGHLTLAEALYQGELLPGFYLEPIVAEQHRLDCLDQKVLHELVTSLIEIGETTGAESIAMRAIDRDPTSEKAHSDLMRVYAAQGKPLAVMRQYRELEHLLQEVFDEQPSGQMRKLAESLEAEASLHAAQPIAGRTAASGDVGAGLAPPASTPMRIDPVTQPEESATRTGSDLPVSNPKRPALLTVLSRRDALAVAGVIMSLLLLLGVGTPLTARLRRPAPALAVTGAVTDHHIPDRLNVVRPKTARADRGIVRRATPLSPLASGGKRVSSHMNPPQAEPPSVPPQAEGRDAASRMVPPHAGGRGVDRTRTKTGVITKPPSPGQELWAQRCDLRPGYKNDATAILADPTGGVFVLGFVYTPETDVDFLILKYSAAGKLLWTRTYDGPGHDCDRARSGAVDAEGNLYVTGESDGGKGDGKGNHNCWDVATMKFNRQGKRLWVQRWAGPGNNADEPVKLCLDVHRNVYVTAKSNYGDPPESGFDWVTLKYDTNGKPLWDPPRRFGGPGDDEPTDMAVDRGGNVYVTGYEVANGSSINRVAKVSQGKVIGDEPLDEVCQCVIVKYTSAGEQKWVQAYTATGYVSARPVGIALDRDGNVTMVATRHAPTISDLLVRKYNRDGRLLWEGRCLLGGGQTGYAAGIVTDRAGRACVLATVNSGSTTTAEDLLTVLYDRDGTLLWSDTVDGAAHGCDNACAVTTDRQGNFIVLGTVDNGRDEARFTAADYVTVKYAPNGKRLWMRYYNGNLCHDDLARAVTVDGQGNVYVVGQSDPGHGQPYTTVTVKYAP